MFWTGLRPGKIPLLKYTLRQVLTAFIWLRNDLPFSDLCTVGVILELRCARYRRPYTYFPARLQYKIFQAIKNDHSYRER